MGWGLRAPHLCGAPGGAKGMRVALWWLVWTFRAVPLVPDHRQWEVKSSHVPMTAWSSSPLPFRDNLQALLIVIGVKEPRSAPDLGLDPGHSLGHIGTLSVPWVEAWSG